APSGRRTNIAGVGQQFSQLGTILPSLHRKGANMKTKIVASWALALSACVLVGSAQQDKKGPANNEALERFKQLAGEWIGKGPHGEMRIVYKVTSGGSAVMETIDPGTDHEMVSMIHADGPALLLTHYCMLGNQPHMKAMPKPGDSKIAFEFVKVTNLK